MNAHFWWLQKSWNTKIITDFEYQKLNVIIAIFLVCDFVNGKGVIQTFCNFFVIFCKKTNGVAP